MKLSRLCLTAWMAVAVLAGPVVAGAGEPLSQPWADDAPGVTMEILANDPERSIVARVSVNDLRIDPVEFDGQRFAHVWCPETAETMVAGAPNLPIVSRHFRISDTQDVAVTVRPLRAREVRLSDPVLPAQRLPIEDVTEIESWDHDLYQRGAELPEVQAWTDSPSVLRDIRMLQVSYSPVIYDPAAGRLTILEEVELEISTLAGPGTNPKTHWGPITPAWAKLYRAVVANPDPAWELARGRQRYLFVIPDEFESRLEGLITWKEEQGYYVDLLRMSEVGNLQPQTLRDRLLQIYGTASRPDWVCLMGNTNNTPWTDDTGFSYTDDLYFALMEGSDYLPDFFFARLPARNTGELVNMVGRTLYWEQQPQTSNPAFYKTAFMASANNYPSQTTTKQQTAERLQRMHDYEVIRTMYSWSGSSVNTIIGWIEDGVSIINYRGEGWRTGWNPSGGSFHVEHVQTIDNPFMTPVFTSIGCGVCGFADADPCFGEAWMNLGTPAEPAGCVTIMGPTGNTHTTFNNWMDRGIYRGLAYDDLTHTAAAYLAGKIYMKTHFPDPGDQYTVEQSFREFVQLGLPDTQYRTSFPGIPYLEMGFAQDSMLPVVSLAKGDMEEFADTFSSLEVNGRRTIVEIDAHYGGIAIPEGVTSFVLSLSGYNLPAIRQAFAIENRWGMVVITEVKPNIVADGSKGDIVELYNPGLSPVELRGWSLTDLDYYDGAFVSQSAVLAPHQLAVIEFYGPRATESVQTTAYGLRIISRAQPGFSTYEDQCILRAPDGSVVDGLAWHNGTGVTTLNQASDISRLTGPGSPFTLRAHGWWVGPDWIHEDDYEQYTINWSAYAVEEGPGSIRRVYGTHVNQPDQPSNFVVMAQTDFGHYGALAPVPQALAPLVQMP